MNSKGFVERIKEFGINNLILSWDTFIGVIAFFLIFSLARQSMTLDLAKEILPILIQVSASLFAIVLAGLAIVTSFTDIDFVHAWKSAGEFDNMITIFQYNLFVPMIFLLYSLFIRFIFFNEILMIINLAFFVYMILALIDLVNFICKYGLQRGNFIESLFKNKK